MKKPNFSKAEIRLCFLRSLCVSAFVLFTIVLVHLVDNAIWITSLGATTFIAFAFPKAEAVKKRVILGGYISACLWGVIAALILQAVGYPHVLTIALCVVAVFLTTMCMTVFDFEHPPSAALALSLVLSNEPIQTALLSILCVVILCLIKMPLAKLILRESDSVKK